MRVSAEKNSPHFHADWMGSHVWLDGKRVDRVIEACEESGWVIRGEYGHREILRGRVSIVNPRMLPVLQCTYCDAAPCAFDCPVRIVRQWEQGYF